MAGAVRAAQVRSGIVTAWFDIETNLAFGRQVRGVEVNRNRGTGITSPGKVCGVRFFSNPGRRGNEEAEK
jgi:hypothetical protein